MCILGRYHSTSQKAFRGQRVFNVTSSGILYARHRPYSFWPTASRVFETPDNPRASDNYGFHVHSAMGRKRTGRKSYYFNVILMGDVVRNQDLDTGRITGARGRRMRILSVVLPKFLRGKPSRYKKAARRYGFKVEYR